MHKNYEIEIKTFLSDENQREKKGGRTFQILGKIRKRKENKCRQKHFPKYLHHPKMEQWKRIRRKRRVDGRNYIEKWIIFNGLTEKIV